MGAVERSDGTLEVVYPSAWDPHGELLLALVAGPRGTDGLASESLEVISAGSRLVLASGQVVPLGWVVDVD